MRIHVLLFLLLIVSSQSQPAAAGRSKALLSSLKTKIAQLRPNLGRIGAVAISPFLVLAVVYPFFESKDELVREIELSYRQREVFMQALVRGEREVVSAQLELDDFALERYIGLTVHYVKSGQHRLGTVASVDRPNNTLRIADRDDLVSHTEVEGVLLLDSKVQGRVVVFRTRDAYLLDPSQKHLFEGRISVFGTVAGVTSGGYLLIRPYVRRDDTSAAVKPFTTLLYLVHEQSLPH